MGYFWGPIPWMIEIAAVLSIIIQHYEDFAIILTLLIVNAVVGFWQEKKADNAIELLKKRLALKDRVLRDGKWSASTLQILIFLKMAVAGHLTIYLARTGVNHFWKRPFPASILFIATEATQVVGTYFAVYVVFMAPIGWGFAAFVWGYALLSFLITDQFRFIFSV